VYGWELGHLEQGHVYSLDSVYFDRIRNWIITAYERGGMNTVSWHGRNPLTGGSAWDVSSREVVASILPGGEKHDLYVQYLDRLAAFFLSLKTGDGTFVPVFFRPYHEHTGSWFWWGKNLCTPEQYIALWRFTITYFRDVKNIHHLLYAYSTDRFETPEDRHAGKHGRYVTWHAATIRRQFPTRQDRPPGEARWARSPGDRSCFI